MVSRFDNSTDMASQIRRDLRLRLEEAERFHRDDWDSSRAINESQIEQLSIYIEFLEKWTRKVDLVSQKSGLDMVIPHIVDSVVGLVVALSLVKSSGFDSDLELDSTTLCDVGSGAGLPGLVWAILRPELSVVLLEPRKRRVDFLTEVRRVLELGMFLYLPRGCRKRRQLILAVRNRCYSYAGPWEWRKPIWGFVSGFPLKGQWPAAH